MKIPVGILGATGMVGQKYVELLADHPWFTVAFLASSEQSAGRSYQEAVAGRWQGLFPIPEGIKDLPVYRLEEITQAKASCGFVFSAVGSEVAKLYEESYAAKGLPVITNASHHRSTPDVPVLIPEVNAEHLEILPIQQKNRHWQKGFIVAKPNCSIQSYMIPLAPLHARFKVKRLLVTTLQALSGAGHPGVSALNIMDNVIPYIPHEEEKSECEPLKIWGRIEGKEILSTEALSISAHCTRVPVRDGHMACVSVQFEQKTSEEEILAFWKDFQNVPQKLKLPSAPLRPIIYLEDKDRPQPRLDREAGRGMSVTVGRLRNCPVFDYRFTALSHNTLRGAAGGGILNAELLHKMGYL